ncbi:hypothetical protein BKA63DRAFT_517745 [Paraphoma chrysanthemicola]|nr:hypothetical protein BKA63DRAFT_517745 [Paraphoma chrysanthemicola]
MSTDRAERYRASMMPHRYGYALFEPQTFARLRPGMLGFLDEYRRWHPLLDLSDPIAVEAAGCDAIQKQILSDPDTRAWGPLESSTVTSNDVHLGGEVDALSLGLPVDIGGAVEYSTATDFGAILMCDDKVESQGFDEREPFLDWLKRNSKAVLARWPDVKKYGVIATTWTYSASKIYIQVWNDASKTVTLGFKLGATGIGGLEPETSWHRAHATTGWSRWDDEKRVVFFTGVKIKYNLFGNHEQAEKKWRGDNNKEFLVLGLEGEQFATANVDHFGDSYEQIKSERDAQLEASRS